MSVEIIGLMAVLFVITTAVRLAVVAVFRDGRRVGVAVTLVNLTVVPLLTVTALLGSTYSVLAIPSVLGILLLVFAEWRLLCWALGAAGPSPRRLLALSLTGDLSSVFVVAAMVAAYIVYWFAHYPY